MARPQEEPQAGPSGGSPEGGAVTVDDDVGAVAPDGLPMGRDVEEEVRDIDNLEPVEA